MPPVLTQGYHFEHNFGHGYRHLSTVFAYLMALAFLIDQVQQHCCGLFQAALAKQDRKRYFREKLCGLFFHLQLPDWETLYKALALGAPPSVIVPYGSTSWSLWIVKQICAIQKNIDTGSEIQEVC